MNHLILNELVHYLDIGIDSNTDLARWTRSNQNIFRLDILAARASASDIHFQKIEKSGTRTVFRKYSGITFTIAADESVQYQLLEAIIEETYCKFIENYGSICCDIVSGMTNMFEGFALNIPAIFEQVQNEKVTWVKAECKICKEQHNVCIKKALVSTAKNFPVSIVYLHRGHGIVIYLDANSRVRGTELVDITG